MVANGIMGNILPLSLLVYNASWLRQSDCQSYTLITSIVFSHAYFLGYSDMF